MNTHLPLLLKKYPLDSIEIQSVLAFQCRGSRRGPRACRTVVRQHLGEIVPFLNWLIEHEVRNYAELGVEAGGNLCLVDAFLRAKSTTRFINTLGIDIADVTQGFNEYGKRYRRCKFLLMNANHWKPKFKWDLIFIDTNQKFRKMFPLAERLRPFCRYIAFHDIADPRYGAKQIWDDYKSEWGVAGEFSVGGPGIGVLKGLS